MLNRYFLKLPAVLLIYIVCLYPNPAAGVAEPPYLPWVHLAELTESSWESYAGFGDILAISEDGDTIVAGVPEHDIYHDDVGLVRVYTKPEDGEWEDADETATLTASDGYAIDAFGITVAISDDLIVVGKQYHTTVYVFVKPADGWQDMTETARLRFVSGNFHAGPGDSVAIMGDSILSGDSYYYNYSFPTGNTGAVFVWNRPAGGWVDTDTIDAMLTLEGENVPIVPYSFGEAIAASGNTLVVGGEEAGAYIFERPAGGWENMTETARLTPGSMSGTSLFGGSFGNSVAIDGDTVLVGAPLDDLGDHSAWEGAAYLFEKPSQGWADMTETAKLTSANGTLPSGWGLRFGHSVSISGKMAAVGAEDSSNAYVFEKPKNGWTNMTETTLFPFDGFGGHEFNPSVALRDNVLVVGYPDKLDVYKNPSHRPVMVIPGIFGSYYFSDAIHEQWNLNRGVHPDLVVIDPLTRAYDDLVQTLKNVGYEAGKDLFIVAYDWRLTPGPVDGVYDGHIGGLSGQSITDGVYQYGVDYLGYYLRKAAEAWDEENPDEALESVDIISHSTGGLVARSYIQSAAYGADFVSSSSKTLALPKVENLIMVAVPNRGASQPWQAMQNNFIIDTTSKYIMAKMINASYQKVLAGKTITGFPADITLDSISPYGDPIRTEFISQYVPTFRSLLATYDFMYDNNGDLGNVNDWFDVRNDLVLDLNNGLDVPYQPPPADPSPFASLVSKTSVFYADSVATEYRVRHMESAAWNAVFRFDDYFESDVPDGLIWYQGVTDNVGDGTVPSESSMGQFVNDNRIQRYRVTSEGNTHTGMMSHLYVQLEILDILDADWENADISNNLANTSYVSALWNAYIDPVDMIVVDGDGRRFGYTAATGPITEIPNSVWFGGDQGIGWILGEVTMPLHLELTGHGEAYQVQVSGAQTNMRGGYEASGFLDADEKISAPVIPIMLRGEHSTDMDRVMFFSCYNNINGTLENRDCEGDWNFGGLGQVVGGNGNNIIVYQYDSAGDYTATLTTADSVTSLDITAAIVETPLPIIDFDTSIATATVSLAITDLDPSDTAIESVIVYWGDRYRVEYNLPAAINHTYTRTGTDYHIRVKAVNTIGEEFNYTFRYDEDLSVSIP